MLRITGVLKTRALLPVATAALGSEGWRITELPRTSQVWGGRNSPGKRSRTHMVSAEALEMKRGKKLSLRTCNL